MLPQLREMERNWVISPPMIYQKSSTDPSKGEARENHRKSKVSNTTWAKLRGLISQKRQKFSVHTHAENFFASIRRLDEQAFGLSGPYLGFECNFRFLQMPYFGRQAKVCDWIAQQTLVIELPLQLGSRRSENAVEYLKSPSDLKFDSNNHSIQCAFPPDFMSNIYAM